MASVEMKIVSLSGLRTGLYDNEVSKAVFGDLQLAKARFWTDRSQCRGGTAAFRSTAKACTPTLRVSVCGTGLHAPYTNALVFSKYIEHAVEESKC